MTLTSVSARLSFSARQDNTVDLGASSARRQINQLAELVAGTGAGQADCLFVDTRTLAASATEDLDLAGALTDAFGVAQVFARVKGLIVVAAAGNTNTVQVTRPASNGVPLFLAAGDGVGVRPGEVLALIAGEADAVGHAVTASTGDLLTFTNGGAGTSVTFDVAIFGCSA